jgi:ectoine hydroxylase-related dioxygenase (phytanoyl-CoA dioxygenase family)
MDYVKSSGKPLLLDKTENAKGSFLLDTGVAARLREFRQFSLGDAAPEIAAALLDSDKINFFGDQIFVKEPGTRERTAFHQDATYFEIEGEKCCVLWIPVDPVTLESGTILYVRGSHRDGKLYQPNVFIAQTSLPGAEGEPLPDIEGHMEDYDIIHFDVEPGDVIVHHYRTIHGAGGDHSRYQVRRAASLRYCGDDIRFKTRPWAPRQLHHTLERRRSFKRAGFPRCLEPRRAKGSLVTSNNVRGRWNTGRNHEARGGPIDRNQGFIIKNH